MYDYGYPTLSPWTIELEISDLANGTPLSAQPKKFSLS